MIIIMNNWQLIRDGKLKFVVNLKEKNSGRVLLANY